MQALIPNFPLVIVMPAEAGIQLGAWNSWKPEPRQEHSGMMLPDQKLDPRLRGDDATAAVRVERARADCVT